MPTPLGGGVAPDVVKTSLDEVVYTEYERDPGPNIAQAGEESVFHQDTATNSAVITENFKGVGLFNQRSEEADVEGHTPEVGDQKTFSVINLAASVDITKNFFDDEMHSTVKRMMVDFGMKAARSQDDNAMYQYREGFDTTTTADGANIFSDSHTTLSGDTVDNKATAALTEDSLNDGLTALIEQKDQAGVVMGHMAECLLVPPALFKKACEITDSELRSGTANNDINVYSSKYNLYVKQSPYLGAAAGGNASDTAWFLLARNHHMTRWVRQALETVLVDWRYQRNNNYIYKGELREVVGCPSFEGLYGSDGSA